MVITEAEKNTAQPRERLRQVYSVEQIDRAIRQLAEKIKAFYGDKEITPVVVLQGADRFWNDLQKELESLGVHVAEAIKLKVSSYGNETSSNRQPILEGAFETKDFAGKNILVIEDLIDSGHTINYLLAFIKAAQAASIETAVLLAKPQRVREIEVPVEFIGLTMWFNRWVAGRGIDSQGKYRELNAIFEVLFKGRNPLVWQWEVLKETAARSIRKAMGVVPNQDAESKAD